MLATLHTCVSMYHCNYDVFSVIPLQMALVFTTNNSEVASAVPLCVYTFMDLEICFSSQIYMYLNISKSNNLLPSKS